MSYRNWLPGNKYIERGRIIMGFMQEYNYWLESDYFDDTTKEELRSIKDNAKEIEDRFYKGLEFGTGGLRGIIGAGTNRMNVYTVRKATQGLANYINKVGVDNPTVVISYDNRHYSDIFALDTALCLCANGIKVFLFDELRPTPELSFAVRYLKCLSGVNITASHNPKEYNGYKVYWSDGAQIVSPQDKDIIAEVNKIKDYSCINSITKEEALDSGLLVYVGEEIDDAYAKTLHELTMAPEEIEKASELKIVYSPLHGTGLKPVKRMLSELGFKNVYVVEEQAVQDGEFPTLKSPNPESPDAYVLGISLAKKVGAELILVTDPDGDRLGMYSLDKKTGEYKSFTGNMFGALLCDYVLMQKNAKGRLPDNAAVSTTVVITDMVKEICAKYNVYCDYNNLIGFKYIAMKMRQYETENNYTFEFGLEDSFGCLPGAYARDKDAVVTVMLLCEAAAYYANRGKTLCDRMCELWEEYGYYSEIITSLKLEGKEGAEKIGMMIQNLRDNPVSTVGNYQVKEIYDYKLNITHNIESGETVRGGLPKSNMIYYQLNDGAWFLVRPSGTEPKIKFYYGVKGNSVEDSNNKLSKLGDLVKKLFES